MGTLHQITPRLAAPARDAAPLIYSQKDLDAAVEAATEEAVQRVYASVADAFKGSAGTAGPLPGLAAKR